jgi:LemA protein
MYYIIASGVIIVALIFWIISVQRTLVVMDENINNAMLQIGVQVSSRWDALTCLLELTKGYAEDEYKTIKESVQARRSITKASSPDDVIKQANIIAEAKDQIMAVAEIYPDLKLNSTYIKTMNAVNQYEKMIATSRLIYNDTVMKLNHEISMFPNSIAAVILGFSKRAYFEEENEKPESQGYCL